jgi:hypothetical protein
LQGLPPVPVEVVLPPPLVELVVEPPMPEPEELELDVVVFPVLVEWVPVVLVLEPVLPPLLPPELQAPKLIPAAQPTNTAAVSHTFFMNRPSEFLVAAP